MTSTTEKILDLFASSGKTDSALTKEIGLNSNAVCDWKKRKAKPSADAITKIANYFHVSTDYLLGLADTPNQILHTDKELEERIKTIGGYNYDPYGYIPEFERVVAGVPIDAQTDIIGYIPITRRPACDYFAIRVMGNSMIDCGITDNSTIVVHKQCNADNRDIVVAILNGNETTVKRLIKQGNQVILYPENRDFSPIIITPDMQFEILGVVVDVITHLK